MTSLLSRYVWLVDTIYSAGKITKHEIDRRWIVSALNTDHEETYEARSFHRHKEAIHELFGIEIRCDRTQGHAYYIANAEAIRQDAYRSWLLSSLAMANIMSDDKRLRARVLFEKVPDSYRFLTPLVEAMRAEQVLDVTYLHEDGTVSTFPLWPYCLKEFRRRWYVVGRTSKEGELLLFELERFQDATYARKQFKFPRSWKADKHFEGYFGVDRSDEPQTITVRVFGKAMDEMLRHPLHASQRLMEKTDEQAVLAFWLAPNREFAEGLRAFGGDLEVVSPGDFRQLFMDDAQRQARHYGMNLHYVGEQLSLF